MKITTSIVSCLLIFSLVIPAHGHNIKHDEILSVDKPPLSADELYFPDTESIQPDKSDFKIISIILLSNKSGERRASVTFENTASGQRILSSEQILAIFANGQKSAPFNIKQKFSRREKITLNLNFGVSKYPILTVYTNN